MVGQCVQHRADTLVLTLSKLGQEDPAADHRFTLARAGQSQQHSAGHRLLVRVELVPGAFGQPGDRAPYPAGLLVGGYRQGAAAAVLPALQQRTRQQRQPAGLLGDLGDHRVGQARFQAQSGPAGGQLDGAAQLVLVHGAD
jgi:hypothetical protein